MAFATSFGIMSLRSMDLGRSKDPASRKRPHALGRRRRRWLDCCRRRPCGARRRAAPLEAHSDEPHAPPARTRTATERRRRRPHLDRDVGDRARRVVARPEVDPDLRKKIDSDVVCDVAEATLVVISALVRTWSSMRSPSLISPRRRSPWYILPRLALPCRMMYCLALSSDRPSLRGTRTKASSTPTVSSIRRPLFHGRPKMTVGRKRAKKSTVAKTKKSV